MAEQCETCPDCGYPKQQFNPDPEYDCVTTNDVRCNWRELVKARTKLAQCERVIEAVRVLRADDNSWPKEQALYEALDDFDTERAKLKEKP